MHRFNRRSAFLVLSAILSAPSLVTADDRDDDQDDDRRGDTIYAISNAVDANQVLVFVRDGSTLRAAAGANGLAVR